MRIAVINNMLFMGDQANLSVEALIATSVVVVKEDAGWKDAYHKAYQNDKDKRGWISDVYTLPDCIEEAQEEVRAQFERSRNKHTPLIFGVSFFTITDSDITDH